MSKKAEDHSLTWRDDCDLVAEENSTIGVEPRNLTPKEELERAHNEVVDAAHALVSGVPNRPIDHGGFISIPADAYMELAARVKDWKEASQTFMESLRK